MCQDAFGPYQTTGRRNIMSANEGEAVTEPLAHDHLKAIRKVGLTLSYGH